MLNFTINLLAYYCHMLYNNIFVIIIYLSHTEGIRHCTKFTILLKNTLKSNVLKTFNVFKL